MGLNAAVFAACKYVSTLIPGSGSFSFPATQLQTSSGEESGSSL